MAPRDGFEPPTNGLTVRRSTTELPGNTLGNRRRAIVRNGGASVKKSAIKKLVAFIKPGRNRLRPDNVTSGYFAAFFSAASMRFNASVNVSMLHAKESRM